MKRSSRVGAAVAVCAAVAGIAVPAAAAPTGEPSEYLPGPEDGSAGLDGWEDGDWAIELDAALSGSTPNGNADLDVDGGASIVVLDRELYSATPFGLGLFGPGLGQSEFLEGSADVRWSYDGDVVARGGQVVFQARTATMALENLQIGGRAAPFPPQEYGSTNAIPLTVTAGGCGLTEGTWDGDLVEGLALVSEGTGLTIEEDGPRTFRAVSAAVDPDWLAEAEQVADRVAALDPGDPAFLYDLTDLVHDAEDVANGADTACEDRFSLGIGAAVHAKLLEHVAAGLLSDADLWRVAELLARSGTQPGSEVHLAARQALGDRIDRLAPGDLGGAAQLLQVAVALGDADALARLQQRLGDPTGALPGVWLPGL